MTTSNNSLTCEVFNLEYLELTRKLINEGRFEKSRNGDTIEVLNFKTEITNPLKRAVGGYGRNANIFFLLQEAIWIWLGKKDVAPLAWFNSNMKNFSDDGETFHAPYGFRLREYGLPSDLKTFDKLLQEQGRSLPVLPLDGVDQIKECLIMLSENSQDRRVVASIWNPSLDLNFKCKDIPCNDMVMFKVRDNALHITIENRSNDVHWGLPTNVFQFSFILEMMSTILGVDMGTQTHNSQSLHVYLSNPTTLEMLNKSNSKENNDVLYDEILGAGHSADKIDFKTLTDDLLVEERLNIVDSTLELAYDIVNVISIKLITNREFNIDTHDDADLDSKMFRLADESNLLSGIVKLLYTYLKYKCVINKTDKERLEAIKYIVSIDELKSNNDMKTLAINFFVVRLENKNSRAIELMLGAGIIDKSLLHTDY